ncbi:unnamed protein product, partial [Ectocarpus sp. 12 AP-2014]
CSASHGKKEDPAESANVVDVRIADTDSISAGGQQPLRPEIRRRHFGAAWRRYAKQHGDVAQAVAPYAPGVAFGSDRGSSRKPKQSRARWCRRSNKTVTRVKTATGAK